MKTEKFIYDMHIYLTFVSKRHCFLWLAMFGYAVVVLPPRVFVKHFALFIPLGNSLAGIWPKVEWWGAAALKASVKHIKSS